MAPTEIGSPGKCAFCRFTMVGRYLLQNMLQDYKRICSNFRKVQPHKVLRKRLHPPCLCPIRSGHQEYDNLTTKLGRKQLEEAFVHVNAFFEDHQESRGFLQIRCLREYIKVIEDRDTSRVILVNLVYPCVPSGQDIYAMLDLDMPLSEAALRTR